MAMQNFANAGFKDAAQEKNLSIKRERNMEWLKECKPWRQQFGMELQDATLLPDASTS
jgi:hypothetical protein